MRFRPAWAYIEGIREFGRFFCETTFGQTDLGERARVVIQEALENAVKYSMKGDDSELTLTILGDDRAIEIAVSSFPDPSHLGALKDEIESMRNQDPEAAYLAAFERAAENPEGASRIGIARMRYEGGVELFLEEQPGGRIQVTARGNA
jgi:hypothetical protein